jgi:hypothetical protein
VTDECFSKLKLVIENLLSEDYYIAAEHIIEEIRIEYPNIYNEILNHYSREYELSGCGINMSPKTAVLNILDFMFENNLIEKKKKNNEIFWKKCSV